MPLTSLLDTWVADQLITPEQAELILVRGDVAVQAPTAVQERPPERSSLVIEALGYLGGVIILVASTLIESWYWDQVGTAARLVIVGGVAAVLLAAGFAVPGRLEDVSTRFRSVVWLLSTGAFSGFMGLLAADALDMAAKDVFLLTSSSVAAYAAGLWLIGRTLVQQLAMMVGVALIWLLLGWGGLLEPSRFVMAFGAAGMFLGAMTTIPTHAGIVLALVTAAAVVATAVLFRDLLLLAVGALGTLQALPASVIALFPGDLAAPIALLVVGALLVGAGLFVARRRHTKPEAGKPAHDFSVVTPAAASRPRCSPVRP